MTAAVDRGAGARISRIDPRASRNPRIRSPAATRGLAKSCSFADPPPRRTGRAPPPRPTPTTSPRLALRTAYETDPDPLRRRRGPEPQAGRDRRRAPRAGSSRGEGLAPQALLARAGQVLHRARVRLRPEEEDAHRAVGTGGQERRGDDGGGPVGGGGDVAVAARAGMGRRAFGHRRRRQEGAVALAADGDARGGREAHRRRHDQVDMLPGAQGGWTARAAALGDCGEDPEEGPQGLDVGAAAEQHRQRVLLRGPDVREGGARARRPRVPWSARIQGDRRRGGEGRRREGPLLQRVRQRALQHEGNANAHQQVVHLRRG
mmetsp:Transcript_9773/g.42611  ORF Transcript_9773/g.42611 Transcript_9773/m.42611 type:complete len:319 (+) Transcript_9773:153-1109(+)